MRSSHAIGCHVPSANQFNERYGDLTTVTLNASSEPIMPSMEIPWKEVFAPDSGTLLDVRVYDTTAADYDRLLGMLATQYRVLYLEDGNAKDLPDYATIIRRRDLVSVSIAIDVFGVEVKCFFWGENELTLDLRPEDVDSTEKAQGIFDLMKAIANTLNKRVLLTAENATATRQWSEEYAIRVFDPPHVQP